MKMRPLALLAALTLAVLGIAVSGCGDDNAGQNVPATGGQMNPQYAEDIRMYEQALANDPNNKDLMIELGNKYYDWGMDEVNTQKERAEPYSKWMKGIDYYKRSLAIDPSNVNVRTDMANLLNWTNQLEAAEKEYRTGMNIDPKHPQVRINLVLLLGKMGKFKEALKEYDALLKVAPEQKGNVELEQYVEEFRKQMKEGAK